MFLIDLWPAFFLLVEQLFVLLMLYTVLKISSNPANILCVLQVYECYNVPKYGVAVHSSVLALVEILGMYDAHSYAP